MIKFFRHIRQRYITEGKTTKYFKYAIGEIILVVIGILIALSINTWNEERKEKAIVTNLLKNIRYDLVADTTEFSKLILKISKELKNSKMLLNSADLDTLSSNALWNKLPYTGYEYTIKSQSYQKVINAGITDFFKFNQLFDDINNYYTIDSNLYNVVRKWNDDETDADGTLWTTIGFEIDIYPTKDFYTENDIEFAQTEATRKAVFLEQIKLPTIRNSIKMNMYRKMSLNDIINKTKQKAKDIIIKIDAQLKE
jgi:hypothetical protein